MLGSKATLRLLGLVVAIDVALIGVVWARPAATGDNGLLPTLRHFMAASHSGLEQAVNRVMQGDRSQRLVITMGNEAADLDSMVAAMTYSYWRHLATDDQATPTMHVPLINIPRKDLSLNPERERVIIQSGQIPFNDLVCIDDEPIKSLFQWLQKQSESEVVPASVEIVLVDHPAPNGRQAFLEPFVRGLLDHHAEEGKFLDATPRWVSLVGSATTLTTLEGFALLGGKGLMSSPRATRTKEDDDEEIPGAGQDNFFKVVQSQPNLFRMLLAPIVLDTGNFSPVLGKTTGKDIEAATLIWEARPDLAQLAPSNAPTAEGAFALALPESCNQKAVASDSSCQADYLTAWFKDVLQAQQDIECLTATEQFRKDYKQSDMSGLEVGVSSITWLFQKWSDLDRMPEFEAALGDYCQAKGLDLLGITTLNIDQSPTDLNREFLLYSPDFQTPTGTVSASTRHAQLMELVKRLQASDLKLMPIPNSYEANQILARKGYIMFSQGNLMASRKQVMPLLKETLKDIIGKTPQASADTQSTTNTAPKSPGTNVPQTARDHLSSLNAVLAGASGAAWLHHYQGLINSNTQQVAHHYHQHPVSEKGSSKTTSAVQRLRGYVASVTQTKVARIKNAVDGATSSYPMAQASSSHPMVQASSPSHTRATDGQSPAMRQEQAQSGSIKQFWHTVKGKKGS
ncbi:Exopolyphosphatase [Dimargaris verticillata]|uniref:Exopolyphosphatase n=1 Tax=Dimargaris verticillata TaxID=2761393 RepID=A0A9W8EBD5_9FUNG|nr:Exopolyphosphatase [Dimargaris verticillata]